MEIELYSKLNDPIAAIKQLGTMFAKSGMFGCEKEEQGQVLAMICLSERKSPVAITTNYDIVEGKLRKKALAALADFRSAGGKHKWLKSGDEPNANDAERFAELELLDKEGNKNVYRYSMADAKAEGLVKDRSRWVKRPGNMLRARCISNGLGMLCPEIFAGEDADEFESAPSKPLLKEDKPEVRSDKSEAQKPIDVVAEVVTEAPKKPEPVASAEPVVTYSANDIELDPATQRLTVKAMTALGSVIGEARWAKFEAWLKKAKWITNEVSELNVERARRVMQKSAEIIANLDKMP